MRTTELELMQFSNPLCLDDLDNQDHMFKCNLIKAEIDINIDETKIYGDKIEKDTATCVMKILKMRNKLIEELYDE